MTPDRLRQLADAFPQGMFVSYSESDDDVQGEGSWLVYEPRLVYERLGEIGADEIGSCIVEEQALLLALGPDAARLLADAMEFIQGFGAAEEPHDQTILSLRDRFAVLGEEQT